MGFSFAGADRYALEGAFHRAKGRDLGRPAGGGGGGGAEDALVTAALANLGLGVWSARDVAAGNVADEGQAMTDISGQGLPDLLANVVLGNPVAIVHDAGLTGLPSTKHAVRMDNVGTSGGWLRPASVLPVDVRGVLIVWRYKANIPVGDSELFAFGGYVGNEAPANNLVVRFSEYGPGRIQVVYNTSTWTQMTSGSLSIGNAYSVGVLSESTNTELHVQSVGGAWNGLWSSAIANAVGSQRGGRSAYQSNGNGQTAERDILALVPFGTGVTAANMQAVHEALVA